MFRWQNVGYLIIKGIFVLKKKKKKIDYFEYVASDDNFLMNMKGRLSYFFYGSSKNRRRIRLSIGLLC